MEFEPVEYRIWLENVCESCRMKIPIWFEPELAVTMSIKPSLFKSPRAIPCGWEFELIKFDASDLIIYRHVLVGGLGDVKQTIRIPGNMSKHVDIPSRIFCLVDERKL